MVRVPLDKLNVALALRPKLSVPVNVTAFVAGATIRMAAATLPLKIAVIFVINMSLQNVRSNGSPGQSSCQGSGDRTIVSPFVPNSLIGSGLQNRIFLSLAHVPMDQHQQLEAFPTTFAVQNLRILVNSADAGGWKQQELFVKQPDEPATKENRGSRMEDR